MKRPFLNRLQGAIDLLKGNEPERRMRTVFGGARWDRNFQDWLASCLPADEEIKTDLRLLRVRSRQLSRDNTIAIAFLEHHVRNVFGATGIAMQAQFRTGEELDETLNDEVEAAYADFCQSPLVDESLAMDDVDELLLKTIDTDGEMFVRMYDGYPNAHGFAIQLIDADQCDEMQTMYTGPDRSSVRMGVQLNPFGKREGYWIHTDPRTVNGGFQFRPELVPAEEMLHLGHPRRANQTRYVTCFHGVMNDMHLLEGYLESEAVAARNHAAPCMVYEDIGETPAGQADAQTTDGAVAEGPKTNLAPGVEVYAPAGKKLSSWAPTHPNDAAIGFVKMWERRIASGLGLSYITLGNDVEGGNFSSQRIAIVSERDRWRRDQQWVIRSWKAKIARRWFINSVRKRLFPREILLPFLDKALPIDWQPRTFEYVSPLEDIQARVLALQYRLTSHDIVTSEQGRDVREVLEQWGALQQEAERLGVRLEPEGTGAIAAKETIRVTDTTSSAVDPNASTGPADPNKAPPSSNGGATPPPEAKAARAPKSRIGAGA